MYKQVKNKSNTKILLLLQIGRLENEEEKKKKEFICNTMSTAELEQKIGTHQTPESSPPHPVTLKKLLFLLLK